MLALIKIKQGNNNTTIMTKIDTQKCTGVTNNSNSIIYLQTTMITQGAQTVVLNEIHDMAEVWTLQYQTTVTKHN